MARADHTPDRLLLALRDDHEQIIIAIRPRLSPGARPEQDDLLRIELLNQPPDDLRQEISRGGWHRYRHRLPPSRTQGTAGSCSIHDTLSSRRAVERSATSSAFMTASVSNSTSIEPPPVRSVAETPSRPSLLMANFTRIGLRAGSRSGRFSVATPTSWQSRGSALSRSPDMTRMSTAAWLSASVPKSVIRSSGTSALRGRR